ncbi:MAG: hypothetical protein PHN49_07370 [Candidatus Omnitrophica bacterium]|nr:hypothetical protein [Candidatus Omnitrophota bacterium]MDD5671441.1 hypothetical protein [Candidatus Omnitrophota bacterium]
MIGILKEELARLLDSEKSYKKAIKDLPKGSFHQKRINGHDYPYLFYRRGKKIVSKYLGNLSEADRKKLSDGIEQRKKYEGMLKEVRENLKQLRKMIRGKKRAV